jgi:hypothetical protein
MVASLGLAHTYLQKRFLSRLYDLAPRLWRSTTLLDGVRRVRDDASRRPSVSRTRFSVLSEVLASDLLSLHG